MPEETIVEVCPPGIARGAIDWFIERVADHWRLICVGEGKGKAQMKSKQYLESLDSADTEL